MTRFLLAAAAIALVSAAPAAAQFWAKPTADVAPQSPGYQGSPDYQTGESPLAAPSSGRAGSLGGSGATGPDSVGTLPERDTDFDRKTWRETPFQTVLQLMAALPDRIDSAAEHELAKNLLVSIADAPPGDDGGTRLLELRVRKLLALGNIDEAAALARAASGPIQDPALAHSEVEAELLAGQIEAACIDLHAFATILTDPGSASALLLCRQRDGETVEGDVPPVDIAMLGAAARISGAPLSADPASASPARLVAAVRDTSLGPEQRLDAAFGAGRASAIYGERLVKVFKGATADAAGDGGPPTSGAEAAALFHAIDQEGDTDRKLVLAARGLLSPTDVADKVSVAMVDPLRNLQPAPELGSLAARVAILFYTVGDIDAATPWAELAEQSGGGAALWPYRVLLKQADPVGIGDWEQYAKLDAPHQARIQMILSAFGVTNPPPPNIRIAGDRQPEPPFGDLIAIDQAAKNGHVGETTLRALALLGRTGPSKAHPLTLKRALADLDAALLHTEARTLAFEAITATLWDH